LLKRFKNIVSDPEVNFTVLFRLSQALFGLFLVLLIPFYLDPIEQGLYFTFLSLTAAQVFFELGLNQVIIQSVSSYKGIFASSKLLFDKATQAHNLIALHEKLFKIYLVLSILFFLIISLIGYFTFTNVQGLLIESWLVPWIILVFFTAVNLFLSPFLSFHEGLGRVHQVYKLRVIQTVIGASGSIVLLILDFKLYSFLALPIVCSVFSFVWIKFNLHHLLDYRQLASSLIGGNFSWFKEIFSLQWRVSLSWISGYFIFHFLQPIIFYFYGPIIAGQFGISFNILKAASNLSISWISPKLPELSGLYFANNKPHMNKVFYRHAFYVMAISLFLLTGLNVAYVLFVMIDQEITSRFLSQDLFLVLSLISFIDVYIFCLALYTRAHREEPFFVISVFSAISTILLASIAIFLSFNEFLIARLFIIMVIVMPWSYMVFRLYKLKHWKNIN
jgi:O-antigen/teichoic acid export membrane protein